MKSAEQDPFAIFLTPPPNETSRERKERKSRDADAQRISSLIDAQLEEDRLALENEKRTIRVLLLGQSGSGKSTAVKLFRMRYAWKDWDAERVSWLSVIQLNIINAMLIIVEALQVEQAAETINVPGTPFASVSRTSNSSLFSDPEKLVLFGKRLREVQVILEKRLGMRVDDKPEETGVDDATDIISSCLVGMQPLLRDEAVRHVLGKRKIKLDYNVEFFLDNLQRIAQRFYVPTSDDVLHASRRTQRVEEYLLNMERGFPDYGGSVGRQWLLYDVGGSPILTDAWLSFFDNVHVIIFFASSSDFDESLLEDSRFNRLEESFQLWRNLCSSSLLQTRPIVLFLSKCDVLKRKLDSGVMFRDAVPSFGERTNDTSTVIKYLQEKFREDLKARSHEKRTSYSYFGSLVGNRNILISATISTVEESIRRSYLQAAKLI